MIVREVILDREGVLSKKPNDYLFVQTEVDFLRLATTDQSLIIVGKRLCDWAELFCKGRNISYREARMPILELQTVCPKLTDIQAKKLYDDLEPNFDSLRRPLNIFLLLQTCYPLRLWMDQPSIRHAAEWLIWIYDTNPPAHVQPLLTEISAIWQAKLPDLSLAYSATNQEESARLIDHWLGIQLQANMPSFDDFPLDVPYDFEKLARQSWMRKAVETHGLFFREIHQQKLLFELKCIAAQETSDYFLRHTKEITFETIHLLETYLPYSQVKNLQSYAPPPEPDPMPQDPSGVINWFRDSYLPYRQWQSDNESAEARLKAVTQGIQFAIWYLDNYPNALAGGPIREYI